jgi:hypothetical protein
VAEERVTEKAPKPVKTGPGIVSRMKDWFKGNF